MGVWGSVRHSSQSRVPIPWGGGPEKLPKIGIPFFFVGPFPIFFPLGLRPDPASHPLLFNVDDSLLPSWGTNLEQEA